MRGSKRERITTGTLVEGRSEKRIFDILGVPYRKPEERQIG
jgi:DNA polymerase IV